MGMQGKNKHSDPIFLLRFFNVLCMVIMVIVPSLKQIWVVHHFQGNYLKSKTTAANLPKSHFNDNRNNGKTTSEAV